MTTLNISGFSVDSEQADCIKTNIPSRAFRYATESKNVLYTPGAMYIGTGLTRETTMTLNDNNNEVTYSSYITAVLEPPTEGNIGDYELKLKLVNLYNFEYDAATTYQKGVYVLYNGKVYKCKKQATNKDPWDTATDEYWELGISPSYYPCWVYTPQGGTPVIVEPHLVEVTS